MCLGHFALSSSSSSSVGQVARDVRVVVRRPPRCLLNSLFKNTLKNARSCHREHRPIHGRPLGFISCCIRCKLWTNSESGFDLICFWFCIWLQIWLKARVENVFLFATTSIEFCCCRVWCWCCGLDINGGWGVRATCGLLIVRYMHCVAVAWHAQSWQCIAIWTKSHTASTSILVNYELWTYND